MLPDSVLERRPLTSITLVTDTEATPGAAAAAAGGASGPLRFSLQCGFVRGGSAAAGAWRPDMDVAVEAPRRLEAVVAAASALQPGERTSVAALARLLSPSSSPPPPPPSAGRRGGRAPMHMEDQEEEVEDEDEDAGGVDRELAQLARVLVWTGFFRLDTPPSQ